MKQPLWYHILRAIAIPFIRVLFPCKVIGRENFPPAEAGPLILCSNHISNMDPIYLLTLQKRHIYFMAKEELFKHKLPAWFFRGIGVFPVTRSKWDTSALDEAERVINNGGVLGIYPEGTRSKTGELQRFKAGAAMIAAKTRARVLVSCVLAKDQKIKLFRRAKLVFGPTLTPEELSLTGDNPDLRAATRTLQAAVEKLMEENR